MDPREERTSVIRSRLLQVLVDRMHAPSADQNAANGPGSQHLNARNAQSLLTPITERSSVPTRENTIDEHCDNPASPNDGDLMRNVTSIMSSSSSNSQLPPTQASESAPPT